MLRIALFPLLLLFVWPSADAKGVYRLIPLDYAHHDANVLTQAGPGPSPYSFSYTAEGTDGSSSHRETGSASGSVSGSYSLKVKDGRSRQVDYTADAGGFKASVDTNEPGTKSDNPAEVSFKSLAPQAAPAGIALIPAGGHAISYQSGIAAADGAPSPYSFGYTAEGADGGSLHQESGDGAGNVRGRYSLKVKDGRSRQVDYSADAGGFKAKINTNELGTKTGSSADAEFISSASLGPAAGPSLYAGFAPVVSGGVLMQTSHGAGPAGEGAPSPYSFSYTAEGADGGSSHEESSDGTGNVRGSYSLKVKDGRRRKVDYTASTAGFKATVNTNEPGTKSDSPADAPFYSSAPDLTPAIAAPSPVIPAFGLPSPVIPSAGVGAAAVTYQGSIGTGEGAPSPYSFSYNVEAPDGGSSRQESSDGAGNVRGSYSLKVKDGRSRHVDYSADAGGFKAKVNTNEPGTKSDSPAEVSFYSSAPQLPAIDTLAQVPVVQPLPAGGPSISFYAGAAGPEGAPKPYSFGYKAEGIDGSSSHQESADGSGRVIGSYALNIKDGRRRKVDYTADAGGFKANVDTNEPGTKSDNPAEVFFQSSAPQDVHAIALPAVPSLIPSSGPGAGASVVSYHGAIGGPEGAPSPYAFQYTATAPDGSSSRQEASDGAGNVRGRYSLSIKDGRNRQVDYSADAGGFKADVKTNEPGTQSGIFPGAAPAPAHYAAAVGGPPSAIQFQITPSGGEGAPSPYSFGYTADGIDGSSSHQETGDGSGSVRGSYSLKIKDGRSRKVDYTADTAGFKAQVDTNEPGTKSENPAAVSFHSSALPAAGVPVLPAGVPVLPAGGAAISYQGGVLTGEGQASYAFGYSAQGAEGGSSHQESGDGSGRVTGSYSLNVNDGRKRKVDYSADAAGFKASVDTNEPGTKSENPAEVSFHSSAVLTAGHDLVAQPYLQTFFNGPRPLTEREKKWMKSI